MTVLHDLTADAWSEIGSGPLLVEKRRGPEIAYVHFAAVAPAIGEMAFHILDAKPTFAYGGTQKCFARAANRPVKVVVTGGA